MSQDELDNGFHRKRAKVAKKHGEISRKADFRRRPASLTMADKSPHLSPLATPAKDAKARRGRT